MAAPRSGACTAPMMILAFTAWLLGPLPIESPSQSAGAIVVGIAPLDVAVVEGASANSSEVLARLIRFEMLKVKGLRPDLLQLPPDVQPPLPPKKAGALGRKAAVDVVLVGTVLEAASSQSSHGASTGYFGMSVGGKVNRSSANVTVHVELINPATGEIADMFEVTARTSGTGLGADIWTGIANVNVGDAAWEKTSMGKALREVSQKIATEVGKRAAGKLARDEP
jgi:curli production assembly/transport component CsgG